MTARVQAVGVDTSILDQALTRPTDAEIAKVHALVRDVMRGLPASERHRIHYASPGADRWKLRSVTYAGIAAAMAGQWGLAVSERAA